MGIRWPDQEDLLSIELELCNGNLEVLDSVHGLDLFATGLMDVSELRLAQYIDPYGKTIFNQAQMADFLSDLDKMPNLKFTADGIETMKELLAASGISVDDAQLDAEKLRNDSAEDLEKIERVRRLALRCRDELDLLLVFTGD